MTNQKVEQFLGTSGYKLIWLNSVKICNFKLCFNFFTSVVPAINRLRYAALVFFIR